MKVWSNSLLNTGRPKKQVFNEDNDDEKEEET